MTNDVSRVPGYGESWFVSEWNFPEVAAAPPRLIVHDTTLRDGEQQAGIVFLPDEKVKIAAALADAGVDRIEAGMIAVSEDDRESIHRIVEANLDAEIWTIARSVPSDIQLAIDAGVRGCGIIMLANAQYRKIFGWTLDEALDLAIQSAATAKAAGLKTTLNLADTPRYQVAELQHAVAVLSDSGQFDAIAIMDTFGTLKPEGTARLVAALRQWTPLALEMHAHNDFGLANANSLAALVAGANAIHTTVLGLGERVGNAATEEVVVAARLLENAITNVMPSHLTSLAEIVSAASKFPIAANKPIVGTAISDIESGTVASEYARWRGREEPMQWLFPFLPEFVGQKDPELVLGKYSGAANVEWVIERLGLEVSADRFRDLVSDVKSEGIRLHRTLKHEEFTALITRL